MPQFHAFFAPLSLFASATIVLAAPALAQADDQPPPICCAVPALTELEIEIDADLSSKTSQSGEMFPIKLVTPIEVDGKIVVPAGTMGKGQVIQASKSSFAGKPGELSIAARYLELGTAKIGLRSLVFSEATGQSNVGKASALGSAGAGAGVLLPAAGVAGAVLSFMITGGSISIPKGTRAKVKTSVAQILPEARLSPSPQDQGVK